MNVVVRDEDLMERTLFEGMTEAERVVFLAYMDGARKSATTAFLWALFFGGIGAHRFYLREFWWGVLYVLLVWTWIPLVVSIGELFVLRRRVTRYNAAAALRVAGQVRRVTR